PTRPDGGGGDRFPNRPDGAEGDRFPNRPDWNVRPDRPIIGNDGNVHINNTPSWTNSDNDRINATDNRWQGAIAGNNMNNWLDRRPDREARWDYWGSDVRHNFGGYGQGFYDGAWWASHPHPVGGWNYWNNYSQYNYGYWWRAPNWSNL